MNLKDDIQKNVDALKARAGDNFICPICKHNSFGVIEGRISHAIQTRPNAIQIGGPAISSMMLVCQHCGYLLEFSLDVLERKES